MKIIRALLLLSLNILLIGLLHHRPGDLTLLKNKLPESIANIPPLGKFLSPFTGFWTNAEPMDHTKKIDLNFEELKDSVKILLDDRLVPHIFAKNDEDLFFAQGYITAQNRLWQMEFLTHYASGRLSEILGPNPNIIAVDRYMRRLGIRKSAEKAIETMMLDPETQKIIRSYTAGVNAYIRHLPSSQYPIEYKLLDYAPEPWTPIKSAYLLKYMAYDLTGSGDEHRMSNILASHTPDDIRELFPNYHNRQDPVIPRGYRMDTKELSPPKVPENYYETSHAMAKNNYRNLFKNANSEKNKGSNNWAIHGALSETGLPILANDPHLSLKLPSIWFEIQLVSPKRNVYGVSIPGSPAVIIGFNQNIAWGLTNTYADVFDFYQLKFKDKSRKEYYHDGVWKKTNQVIETIKVRGGETLYDTVSYTHHGPVVLDEQIGWYDHDLPMDHALRWIAHDRSNELLTFVKLNEAKNYEDYVNALKNHVCPAQNFVYADAENNIALWVNGKFPLKWKEQGKYILDGSDPQYDWQDFIPHEYNPHIKNPKRNFVSSANQFSIDTTYYQFYLNWDYSSPERGIRINEVLSANDKMNKETFRNLQNDNFNVRAKEVLPILLKHINPEDLNDKETIAYQLLSQWDYKNDAESKAATLFDYWWRSLITQIWSMRFDSANMRFPSVSTTISIIQDQPDSKWLDDPRTKKVERLKEIARITFQKAIQSLTKKYGTEDENWMWWKVKDTHISHFMGLEGFGTEAIKMGGGSSIVNATSATHGPSWRMIVELGERPKGFGIYPGGQSGNPGSFYYDNMIQDWSHGDLYELLYFREADTKHQKIITVLELH